MHRSRRSWATLALAATLALLLAALATLQLHWIDELADAETERLGNFVATGVGRIAVDLERELVAIEAAHGGPSADDEDLAAVVARRHVSWRENAPHPEVVAHALLVDPNAPDTVKRLDPLGAAAASVPWPSGLDSWHHTIMELSSRDADALAITTPSDPPGLLIPLLERTGRSDRVPPVLLLIYDAERFGRDVLSGLAERHLGQPFGPPIDVLITVGVRDEVVFRSHERLVAADFETADAREFIGGTLQLSLEDTEGRAAAARRVEHSFHTTEVEQTTIARAQGDGSPPPAASFDRTIESVCWEVRARHASGSVAAAGQAVRNRNLVLGFGILAILALASGLLVVGIRRARQLGERQVEFVAGVTHELRTPLSAIRSAAQNLRDGIVDGRDQARRYGELIDDESRRLGELVEQALAFAGASQPGKATRAESIELARFLRDVIDRHHRIDNARTTVRLEVPADAPRALAAPHALALAIGNLLNNARKYTGDGDEYGVRVTAPEPERVDIAVWDRGPGIPASEQHRLFDPFFRGERARDSQAPGSGLGLAVVRRIVVGLGGSVSVESEPGSGSTFTLHLPATESS